MQTDYDTDNTQSQEPSMSLSLSPPFAFITVNQTHWTKV